MKRLKHSKYRDTGILYELLVRQVASDLMNERTSKATKIISEYFGKKTELAKELRLYQMLTKAKFDSDYKATELINIAISERKKLNNSVLDRQKYNLIKEIKKNYVLETFFKYRIPKYKENASIYKLFENTSNKNPQEYVECKSTIVEHITSKSEPAKVTERAIDSLDGKSKDVRLLAFRMLIEAFNKKYNKKLTPKQKNILKEYIYSVDNSDRLKEFVTAECNFLKESLSKIKVSDEVLRIKLSEVVKLLDTIKASKVVNESQILPLLRFHDLRNELKRTFK